MLSVSRLTITSNMKRHSTMDSDTDSSTSHSTDTLSRLGKCEVCGADEAKYTCPKCEVKTCCLHCIQIHKKELACNGIRDRTKFIPLKKMTKMDFMNDYYFLEECTRFVEDRKHDRIKRYTRYNKLLPATLYRLRNAAASRKTTLRFLLDNFSRRKENSTYLNWNTGVIYWHVEWVFVNATNLKFVDKRCCEDKTLADLLDKYINPENVEPVPMKKTLEFYQSAGIGHLQILLKAEGVKRCRNRFYSLDCAKSLKENLVGKTLVEFPSVYVIYDKDTPGFDVIESDEDIEAETAAYKEAINELARKKFNAPLTDDEKDIEEEQKKAEVKIKREERRIKREQFENDPKNYLFSDEKIWDIISSSSDSENGNITEEEGDSQGGTSAPRKR